MTSLAFDIYPADDPVAGALLVRLTKADLMAGTVYRSALRGPGEGKIVIHSAHAAVVAGHLAADNYVRVVELGYDQVIGGFWLVSGDTTVLSRDEQGGEIMSYGGPGTLHYLARATVVNLSRSPAGGPNDQFWIDSEGHWVWGSDGSETYGGILRRLLVEALLDDPTAIPDRGALSWDDLIDSSAASWTTFTGEYRIRVGDNLLDAVLELMRKGIDVVMDPDTFDLDAYLSGNYGTIRTSGTFAVNKVRFAAGINIAADLDRAINRLPYVSHLLVIGDDGLTEGELVDPDWSVGETVYRDTLNLGSTSDVLIMAEAGAERIRAGKRSTDMALVPHLPGATPLSGLYAAGVHYKAGDTVTLHTGTAAHDYNEQAIQVAAFRYEMTAAGDFHPTAELGAAYMDARSAVEIRALAGIISGHTHPPNPPYCQDEFTGSSSTTRLYPSVSTGSAAPTMAAPWDVDSSGVWTPKIMYTTPQSTTAGGASTSSHASNPGADYRVASFFLTLDAALAAVLAAGGGTFRGQFRVKSRHGVGINEGNQDNISQVTVRVTQGTTSTVRGTAYAGHALASSAGSVKWLAASGGRNAMFPPAAAANVLSAVAGTVAGDRVVVEVGYRTFSITTSGATMYFNDTAAADLPSDETTTSDLRSWIELVSAGSGAVAGDLPLDTVRQGDEAVGTSIRVTRCDHQHAHGLLSPNATDYHGLENLSDYIFHGATAPAVTDDGLDGYVVGTHWIADDTDEVYILVDPAEGAAVWKQITGTGGTLIVQEDDSTVDAAVTTLDFTTALNVTSSPAGEANIAVDLGTASTQAAAGDHTHTAGDSSKASASSDLAATTTTAADVTGATLSLAAGTYIVAGNFDVSVKSNTDRLFEGVLDVGGVDENDLAVLQGVGLDTDDRVQVPQLWRVVLGSTTTVKLQARHSGGAAGDFAVNAANTTLTAWVAGGSATNLAYGRYLLTGASKTLTGTTAFTALDTTADTFKFTRTTGAHPVLIGCHLSAFVNNAAGNVAFDVAVDGTLQGAASGLVFAEQHGTASRSMNLSFTFLTAPLTAGSHTFELRWKIGNSAHTATLYGGGSNVDSGWWIAEQYLA